MKIIYRVIDRAGRWLTFKGFDSYVHYDALKFNSLGDAVAVAKRYNAEVVVL